MRNRQIHLTNYSVQKNYDNYGKNCDTNTNQNNNFISSRASSIESSTKLSKSKKRKKHKHPFFAESKWSIQQLWKYLNQEQNVDTTKVIADIHDVLIKTMIGSASNITPKVQRSGIKWDQCFEVYGFDILLDHNLKPWLLEVNLLPSLSSSSPLDKRIKLSHHPISFQFPFPSHELSEF